MFNALYLSAEPCKTAVLLFIVKQFRASKALLYLSVSVYFRINIYLEMLFALTSWSVITEATCSLPAFWPSFNIYSTEKFRDQKSLFRIPMQALEDLSL